MSVADAHGWTGAPAKNAATACSAQPLKSLPSTEWPVNGTTCDLRVRDQRGDAAGVRGRRSQVLRAGEDQRGHVGQRARRRGRRRGVRPGGADRARGCCRARWSRRTGRSRGAGWARRKASASASRVVGERRRAATGTGVSSQVVVTNSASSIPSEPSVRGRLRDARDQPLREQVQAQQRVGVVVERRAHGRRAAAPAAPGSGRRPAGCSSRPTSFSGDRVPPARAVVGRPAESVSAQARGQAREVADRVGGDAGAGVRSSRAR